MKARVAAGLAVLAAMAWVAAGMVPPYLDHLEFRSYLDRISAAPDFRTAPPDLLAMRVARQAESMGIPLRASEVRVTRAGGITRMELKYVVPVELFVYSVDLHFRESR